MRVELYRTCKLPPCPARSKTPSGVSGVSMGPQASIRCVDLSIRCAHASQPLPSSGHLCRYDVTEVSQRRLRGVQEGNPHCVPFLTSFRLLVRSFTPRILRSLWRPVKLRLRKSCVRRLRLRPFVKQRGEHAGRLLARPHNVSNTVRRVASLQLGKYIHFLERSCFHFRLDRERLRIKDLSEGPSPRRSLCY